MAQIVMINWVNLFHHPDNPRKNLGDVSELAASIKEKGILQNLTVVPIPDEEGNYYIVIGNRRYEAGKAAGIHDFPCVIADMDYATQLETMLIENMQRSDLTVLEEAQGFQQLMFEGYSVEQISKKTGFSQSTVRRRTQLADYNEDVVQQAFDRGGTLEDFAKLNQIEDEEERNHLAKEIGTSNFSWNYNNVLHRQKKRKIIQKLKDHFKEKVYFVADYVEKAELAKKLNLEWYGINSEFKDIYASYDITRTEAKEIIEIIETNKVLEKYPLVIELPGDYGLYIRFSILHEKTADEKSFEMPATEKHKEEVRKNREALNQLNMHCYNNRYDFVRKKYMSKLTKKDQCVILSVTAKLFCFIDDAPNIWNRSEFIDLTVDCSYHKDVEDGFYTDIDGEELEINADNVFNILLAQIYTKLDDKAESRRHIEDYSNNSYATPITRDNDDYPQAPFALLLELLLGLGYETSDEEQQYYDGTHPLFIEEGE